jgi:predicted GNAT family acetyltransferase
MAAGAEDISVRDNAAESRYELHVGDRVAGMILYETSPGVVTMVHTEIDPDFEGRGLGSRLIAEALADVRRRGLRVVIRCPFIRHYLTRHPEDGDLVTTTGV